MKLPLIMIILKHIFRVNNPHVKLLFLDEFCNKYLLKDMRYVE